MHFRETIPELIKNVSQYQFDKSTDMINVMIVDINACKSKDHTVICSRLIELRDINLDFLYI